MPALRKLAVEATNNGLLAPEPATGMAHEIWAAIVLRPLALSLWGQAGNPHYHPCGHIVYPYTDETLVWQAVCLFACAGQRDGEGVILINVINVNTLLLCQRLFLHL